MQTTMHMEKGNRTKAGKLTPPSFVQAWGDGKGRNRLILTDRKTGMRYLIDTGADISVIPRAAIKVKNTPSELKLYAANGTPIRTYGEKCITVDLGLRRQFIWPFLVADVTMAILGADFLEHYRLLVDLANRQLRDEQTNLHSPGHVELSTVPTVTTIDTSSRYSKRFYGYNQTISDKGRYS